MEVADFSEQVTTMNTKDYETTEYAKRKLALTESQRPNTGQESS
jgi:hypothetical protein